MATKTSIKLYTDHNCPWAQRAHIALAELGLAFEEEIIDLSVPRKLEYLKINPRGQVPTLVYGDSIIYESSIIAQFLADSVPATHLTPRTGDPDGALRRQRIAYFVETYFSKANTYFYPAINAKTDEDADRLGELYAQGIVKEIEPLLQDAKPFFGGSDRLTMAEVLTGSFILRVLTLAGAQNSPLPKTMVNGLASNAPKFYSWAQAVVAHPSVIHLYNKDAVAGELSAKRIRSRALA